MYSKDFAIIVLTGQTNFINQINRSNHEALRQRISVNYHLEGLGANEIKDYIVSRLSAAGCTEPIFADDCFELLYSMTNGHLSDLRDIFWNIEKLCSLIGEEDWVTVATAIKYVNEELSLWDYF